MTDANAPISIERWAELDLAGRRALLAARLSDELASIDAVAEVVIQVGPIGREYDFTAAVETDVGVLRTPLWSHARAEIFGDASVHPANRRQLGPDAAVRDAADRLRRRLSVPYRLESRGLTVTMSPESGVERTWTAEHSLFRKRTAVVREDRVENAGEVDVRDLLAHFYSGPSLRLVGEEGDAFLLPAAGDVEGPTVTLCYACRQWAEGAASVCAECGSDRVDSVVAVRRP